MNRSHIIWWLSIITILLLSGCSSSTTNTTTDDIQPNTVSSASVEDTSQPTVTTEIPQSSHDEIVTQPDSDSQ